MSNTNSTVSADVAMQVFNKYIAFAVNNSADDRELDDHLNMISMFMERNYGITLHSTEIDGN